LSRSSYRRGAAYNWYVELAAGAFLACEDGLLISGHLTLLGGLIGQSDLVGVLIENPTKAARKVWVTGNGAAREHKLGGKSDSLCVDNHRVLGCTPGTKSAVGKAGSLASAIFGGEGIVTCFEGPGKVWTQTRRSLPYLIEKVAGARDSVLDAIPASAAVAAIGELGGDDKDEEKEKEPEEEEDGEDEPEDDVGDSEGGGSGAPRTNRRKPRAAAKARKQKTKARA
jgi:hypothetical protein